MENKHKKIERYSGIAAIIINSKTKKILLIKRRNLPIIQNKGIWSFLFGGKKKNETYLETAYREIKEETKLEEHDLKIFSKPKKMLIFDDKRKERWYNYLYLFLTNTERIKLSFENSSFRWADPEDIFTENNYKNIFFERKAIELLIKNALDCL